MPSQFQTASARWLYNDDMLRKPARPYLAAFVLSFVSVLAWAAPRPLTHQDYDSWRSIQSQQLSRNGQFLAYALFPQDGDGELVLRNLVTGQETRESIGARPPLGPPDPAQEEGPPIVQSIRLAFSPDSQYLVFSTFPRKADTDAAKKAKKKPEEMPPGGLVTIHLLSGRVTRTASVKGFQLPGEGTGFLAYQLTPKPAADTKPATPAATTSPARRGRTNEVPSELVLRKLADGTERTFPDVTEYALTKDSQLLVYAAKSKAEETSGIYHLATGAQTDPAPLLRGKGRYVRLTWDESQKQLAFLSDRDDVAARQPRLKLYGWTRQAATPVEYVSAATAGFPAGAVISDRGAITFSKDGQRLFFGTAPAPKLPTTDNPDEQAVVDLWHWKDDYIQPMQKVRAELDRTRSFRAVYHEDTRQFVQLADRTMAECTPNEDGRWAFGGDDREYRALIGYDERYVDSYLVDTRNGERKLLAKKHIGPVTWSPDGRYALLFNGKDWSTIAVPTGTSVNLTKSLGVNFATEEHDTPSTPGSYGLAGWTKDGRFVLLYDHYDIWQVAPDGSSAKNLTDGMGRKEKLMFRYVKLDPEEKSIDPTQALLLRAEHAETHDTGFYRDQLNGSELPRKLLFAAKNFSAPVKAKNADVLLLTAATFQQFPNLQTTTGNFQELRQVSDANPQQADLAWGTAELVRFRNTDGVPLQGTLYKPANFDPQKKYPLLVYIYERLSQNVHNFIDPRPTNSINPAFYASNGYLVFEPDIVYKVGYPGQSALNCVLPGVQAVVDKGIVDEQRIGIQGHSWGGYQIAYMITQTNRFRAVSAGAPVANMISAYGGIRWGTGLPRQFQYEHTQSRIGGSLWQYPLRYIENSPVFMADRIKTPVLMIHNDADDAVPWYQGIEYYLALRRLGKECYLFSYNGEPHNLRKRANQKDYTLRLQQYFDYYLRDAPKPDWMEHGIPYLDKAVPPAPAASSDEQEQ